MKSDARRLSSIAIILIAIVAAGTVAALAASHMSSDESAQGVLQTALSDESLSGLDEVIGSTSNSVSAGTEPVKLTRNSPLVVVAMVDKVEVIARPVQIDPTAIPWPPGGPGTPGPGDDPKGGLPTGPITVGFYSTRYTLHAQEILKGPQGDYQSFQIVQGGALIDGKEVGYEGIPMYRLGESYLLFLEPNPIDVDKSGQPEQYFSSVSAAFGSFLLKNERSYRSLGDNNSWEAYESMNQEELLDLVRVEARAYSSN